MAGPGDAGLATARENYRAARAEADAEFGHIWDPAREKYAAAETDAAAIGERVPRADMDEYMRAAGHARESWEAIVAGPRAAVDQALREAGVLADGND